jgi:hypothetical protein
MAALFLTFPHGGAAAQVVLPADATSSTTPTQQNNRTSSRAYLDEAARVFESIPPGSLKDEAQKRVATLRKHFAELISTYNSNSNPFVYPAVPQSDDYKSTKKDEAVNWKMAFTEVENDLAGILGGGATLPVPTSSALGATVNAGETVVAPAAPIVVQGTTGQIVLTPQSPQAAAVPPTQPAPAPPRSTVPAPAAPVATDARGLPAPAIDRAAEVAAQPVSAGTAGTSAVAAAAQTAQAGAITAGNAGLLVGAVGVPNLDPAVRRQLEQFRLNVELFFAATTMNFESETTR